MATEKVVTSGDFRGFRDRGDRILPPRMPHTKHSPSYPTDGSTRTPGQIPLWDPSEALRKPRVRLAQATIDEGMFAILARIDEALRTRELCGDKVTLDRIQELFSSRFRDFGL